MSFSIELELQKFPRNVKLKDGKKATLRPLSATDEKDFHELFQGIPEREILVMGDRNTPYQLLRKVMATCSAADYSKISFAVLRAKEGST